MRSSDRDRPDHQRLALAVEAARIIQEEGLLDFRSAKAKAAARLGLGRRAHLPDNAEIEAALAERNRIFHGETLPELLTALRQAAFELMRDLGSYQPRLVGDVLSGNATIHTSVDLHLFSDTSEAVSASLESLGVSHRSIARRHRLRHDEVGTVSGLSLLRARLRLRQHGISGSSARPCAAEPGRRPTDASRRNP